MALESRPQVHIPRVAIKFCVQCKWNLRAAYDFHVRDLTSIIYLHAPSTIQYAQELLQTFGTALGEVSLIPVTGGIFTITITYATETSTISDHELWDRKTDGGFPETKELKNRVRNIVEPGRDLGHIDRSLKKGRGDDGGEMKPEKGGASVNGTNTEATAATANEVSPEHKEPIEAAEKNCEDCA